MDDDCCQFVIMKQKLRLRSPTSHEFLPRPPNVGVEPPLDGSVGVQPVHHVHSDANASRVQVYARPANKSFNRFELAATVVVARLLGGAPKLLEVVDGRLAEIHLIAS